MPPARRAAWTGETRSPHVYGLSDNLRGDNMKYAVLLLAVLLAACAPAAGQPLTQATVFETGPFDCDRQTLTWTWEAGQDTYIRQAESWQGMDMGAVADF